MAWLQAPLAWLLIGLPYILAALMGLGLSALGVLGYSRFVVGMGVIALTFVLEALYMSSGGLQLGIALYYTDLSMVFIAALTVLRWLLVRDVAMRQWAWTLYVCVFVVNLAWGLAANGTSAGVQARPYFYAIVIASYAMSFRLDDRDLRRLITTLAAASVCFMLLCAYRWTVYYLPITELLPEEGNYNIDGAMRVIRSNEALVIAQSLVICLFVSGLGLTAQWMRVLAPALLGVVIALQHRSVWVATLAGVLFSFLVAGGSHRSRVRQLLLLGAIVMLTALPMVLSDQLAGVASQVSRSAQTGAAGEGTASERLDSWQQILQGWSSDGPVALAIGRKFGSDVSRLVHDQTTGGLRRIAYTAHNHYIQTLSSLGLLGLLGFLATFAYALTGLYRLSRLNIGGGVTQALLVLLLMQAVYYIPYSTDYFQHLILGMALAYVQSHQAALKERAAPTTPPVTRASGLWRLA
jgi:hypothetical protein